MATLCCNSTNVSQQVLVTPVYELLPLLFFVNYIGRQWQQLTYWLPLSCKPTSYAMRESNGSSHAMASMCGSCHAVMSAVRL